MKSDIWCALGCKLLFLCSSCGELELEGTESYQVLIISHGLHTVYLCSSCGELELEGTESY